MGVWTITFMISISNRILNQPFIYAPSSGTMYGTRTRDSSVKGRRLNPLTNAAFVFGSAKIGLCMFPPKQFSKFYSIKKYGAHYLFVRHEQETFAPAYFYVYQSKTNRL